MTGIQLLQPQFGALWALTLKSAPADTRASCRLIDCRSIGGSEPRARYTELILQLLDSGQFGVHHWSNRMLLLERDLPPEPVLDQVRNYVSDLAVRQQPCWQAEPGSWREGAFPSSQSDP